MAIPTFLIGLLPGYQTIGVLAPIGLTLLRVVQGLSVGGEYTGSPLRQALSDTRPSLFQQ
jgi:MFS transporter, MHS family, proline/betaine transporter